MDNAEFVISNCNHNRAPDSTSLVIVFSVGMLFLALFLFIMDQDWFGIGSFLPIFAICLVAGSLVTFLIGPRILMSLFIAGFLLRVMVAVGVYYYLLLNYGFKGLEGNDDLFWNDTARAIATGHYPLTEALKNSFSVGYSLIVAAVYEIGGQNFLNPRVLNSLLGAWVVVAGYHLAHEIFESENLARRVAIWLTFFPVLIFWSTAFHKDILICLCMTVGVYACLRLYKRGAGFQALILLFSSVVAIFLLRTFAGYILILTCLCAVYYRLKKSSLVEGVGTILIFFILFMAIAFFVTKHMGREEVVNFQSAIIERAKSFEQSSEKIADRQYQKGVSSIMYAGPRALRLITGPVITLISPVPPGFAWKSNFSHSFLSVFQPLQLLLLPFFIFGFIKALFDPEARTSGVLLLLPPVMITLIANSFYAAGMITKYRIMVEPLLLILAAWIYHISSPKKRILFFTVSILLAFLTAAVYLILRSFVLG